VKIGPVDPEIICLKLKKEDINASKIYSPIGRFADWAKLHVHIMLLSWPYILAQHIHRVGQNKILHHTICNISATSGLIL